MTASAPSSTLPQGPAALAPASAPFSPAAPVAARGSRKRLFTYLGQLVQGQSVMLATNQVLLVVALSFCLGGCVIWLAHRPQMNPATGGAR